MLRIIFLELTSILESLSEGILSSRLRVSHISSHFVDGHYDNTVAAWKDWRPPVVYSREFLDGVVALEPSSMNDKARIYLGATYLFHVDPKNLARFMADAGWSITAKYRRACIACTSHTRQRF